MQNQIKFIYKFCTQIPKNPSNYKFPQIPKILPQQQEKGNWFSNLFKNTYISQPSYELSQELFYFLNETDYLDIHFPIIKQNHEIHSNIMALHVCLLKNRMMQENDKQVHKEADTLIYYCKTNCFPEFAKKYNDYLPAEDFGDYYIETYSNRVNMVEEELQKLNQQIDYKLDTLDKIIEKHNLLFRKIIFFNIFEENHPYINKITKYYLANKNYIDGLTYSEILNYKIYWGLEKDPEQLEFFNDQK